MRKILDIPYTSAAQIKRKLVKIKKFQLMSQHLSFPRNVFQRVPLIISHLREIPDKSNEYFHGGLSSEKMF